MMRSGPRGSGQSPTSTARRRVMTKKTRWTVAAALATLLLGSAPVQAQHRGGGFYHGGFYHGGYGWGRPYGYYPYGFYRPYYGVGAFGLGLGLGLGLGGLYAPYYGSYAYPLP